MKTIPTKQSPRKSRAVRDKKKITYDTLEGLEYVGAFKQILHYKYKRGSNGKMTWSVATKVCNVTTMLDGKETVNVANPGDIVMCGPRGEKYVVRMEKMGQLYERSKEDPYIVMVKPEKRMVAEYNGAAGEFIAPWGELMKINPGDYVVREDKGKYYRIERSVFNETYIIQ